MYNRALAALGGIKPGRQDPEPPHEELQAFWTTAVPKLSRLPFFIGLMFYFW